LVAPFSASAAGQAICHFFILTLSFFPIEKNGKTLHLLKSGSKPVQGGKKRKQIPIMGTFGQYNESKKKAFAHSA